MIHQRQCLSFRLEPGNDALGIHPELAEFERSTTSLNFLSDRQTTLTTLKEHVV
jgi:hypothetical protein